MRHRGAQWARPAAHQAPARDDVANPLTRWDIERIVLGVGPAADHPAGLARRQLGATATGKSTPSTPRPRRGRAQTLIPGIFRKSCGPPPRS